MGIRDKPTAPASPWQNGFAERLIGSIRRECVDHIIVLGEVHLRQILQSYAHYYNDMTSGRTGHWTKMHQSLVKFSESEASNHTPSLADSTTTTPELKFSVLTTAIACPNAAINLGSLCPISSKAARMSRALSGHAWFK